MKPTNQQSNRALVLRTLLLLVFSSTGCAGSGGGCTTDVPLPPRDMDRADIVQDAAGDDGNPALDQDNPTDMPGPRDLPADASRMDMPLDLGKDQGDRPDLPGTVCPADRPDRCGWLCVDLDHDPSFCGDCLTACPSDSYCDGAGACQPRASCQAQGCGQQGYCDDAIGCLPGCAGDEGCPGTSYCELGLNACRCGPGELACAQGCCPQPGTGAVSEDSAEGVSLAVDSLGRPQLSYYDLRDNSLRHAAWGPDGWILQIVDDALGSEHDSSMVLDRRGLPHIAYFDGNRGELRYAYFDGQSWQREKVADGAGGFLTMVFDAQQIPQIAYQSGGNTLRISRRGSNGGWSGEVIDNDGAVGGYLDLVLAPDGTAHTSYYDGVGRNLKYARRDPGGGWSPSTVDRGTDLGRWSSIALDAQGRPHISYQDHALKDLRYSFYDGNSWQTQTVDAPAFQGRDSSLLLDVVGRPRVAYEDSSNGKLKLARWDGASWQKETIDDHDGAGREINILLDPSGSLHVSYIKQAQAGLRQLFYRRID